MKKKLKGIIIGGAAVVVLAAGIGFMQNYEPKNNDSSNGSESSSAETVFEAETAERITVTGSGAEIGFFNKDGEWSIAGTEQEDTDQTRIKNFVDAALVYRSDKLLGEADPVKYGLDAPILTVTIVNGDNTDIITVGDKSAVDDVYFAAVNGDIFTMSESQYNTLSKDITYYTEFSRIAIDPDDITEIKITRADCTIDLYLPELTRLEGNVWQMREPYTMMANDSFIDSDILNQLGAITLSEKADSIGEKTAELYVVCGDTEYDFVIGSSIDGKTRVGYDGKAYLENSSYFEFINADIFNYINKMVSYVNILDVSELDFEYNGESHNIEISGTDNMTFKADGIDADTNLTKKIYQSVIGITAKSFYGGEELGEQLLKVVFKGTDGVEDTVVEYNEVNEYSAAIVLNGEPAFITDTSGVEKLKSNIDEYYRLVKGE